MKRVLGLGLVLSITTSLAANIVVNPTSLSLGNVDRNSGAAATLKVTNGFPAQTTFSVGFSAQSGNFQVSTAPLNLAPNQQGSIPLNIEAGSSPGNYAGTFTIQGGGASVTVPVTATVFDALATTFSPNLLDFGTVVQGQTRSMTLNVTNTSPGALTYSGSANPSLYSVPTPITLGSNQSGTLTVTFNPGSTVGNFPGTVNLKANNSVVGTINLKSFSAVPEGSIQTTPASLDFGDVNRSSGASMSYTLKNASASSLTFNLARTGNFSTSTAPVSLGPGQSKIIPVNVEAGVPQGLLSGSITISGGGQTETVTLRANVLDLFATSLTPAILDFGTLTAGSTKNLSFVVQNQSSGSLSYTPQANPSLYSVSPSSLAVAANQTGTFTVTLNPGTSTGSLPGTIQVNAASGTASQSAGQLALKANVSVPPKPDLTVSFASATPTIAPDRTGARVASFSVSVQNAGAGAVTSSFAMKIFLDNVLMNTETVSLGKANNFVLGFVVPPHTAAGAHAVRVQVDGSNQIVESNESNNNATLSVTF